MSTTPESDFDIELHFLPAWAQRPANENRYANFEGDTRGGERGRRDRDDRRGRGPQQDRPRRREGSFGPRSGPGGPGGAGGPPPGGPRRGPRRDDQRDDRRRSGPPMDAPKPLPLPEIDVTLVPDEVGVDSLARQIRITGRAYPLFEIAQMVLQKPERHTVTLTVKKKPDGTPVQPLFQCALDESLWLSEDEAVAHVLEKHFTTFYQPEKTSVEPPKGVYTFVGQCGLSGVILGPPNHHDYQNQLRRLHAERFNRMPFEAYKARVRIVRDEAVVKKWIEEQSFTTQYVCLNMAEPLKLANREEVARHFREQHAAVIIKPIETVSLAGTAARNLRQRDLVRLVRTHWEQQRHFPIQVATVLSQQFAHRGLQFFKVNRTVTHVAVARPHYLDLETTPVSENIRRIVDYINAHAKCSHKQLLETLAPRGATPPAPVEAPVPLGEAGAAPTAPPETVITPEMAAVQTDLHWLIHQGHVIEFANGVLEMAKKPIIKPFKPAPAPAPAPAPPVVEAAAEAAPAAVETAPVLEAAAAETPPAEPEAEATPAAPSQEEKSPA